MSLSVVINTKNTASILRRALESVAFADEIIIVDMHSTDQTIAIAKEFTDQIFQFDDVGYVEPARNFALSKTHGEWILIIDADEELSKQLQKVVKNIVQSEDQSELPDCFYIPRKNIIFDQWIQKTGWWPDYVLRLFRQGYVEWSSEIHAVPITRGEVKELPAQEDLAIIHHNYQSVDQYLARLNRYTTIQASQQFREQRVSASTVFTRFTEELLRRLFAQQGIEEGTHGVSLSLLQALSEAVVEMKVWEAQGFIESEPQSEQMVKQLNQFSHELAYWIADWNIQNTRGLKRVYWQIRRKLML